MEKFTVHYSAKLAGWVVYEQNGGIISMQRSYAIKSAEKAHKLAREWEDDLAKGLTPKFDYHTSK